MPDVLLLKRTDAMPRTTHTQPRRVLSTRRRGEALRLRVKGLTFQEIADSPVPAEMGGEPGDVLFTTRQAAHKAITDELRKVVREPAEQLVALELTRLDTALAASWDAILRGDGEAIRNLLRIQQQRARYVAGLYSDETSSALTAVTGMLNRLSAEAGDDPMTAHPIVDDVDDE